MDKVEILGLVAAVLTTASFVPQVLKVWKQKSTKDISLSMYVVFSLGLGLWLVYGFYINSLSIMIANSITLVLTFAIIWAKLKYK